MLGQTFAWLTDIEWRDTYGPPRAIPEADLLDDYARIFQLADNRKRIVARLLREWKVHVPSEKRTADLVGELYGLLDELEFHETAKLTRRGEPADTAQARAIFLVGQMTEAFDDAEVTGWEGLEGTYGLPDPNDEHVVAAAVVGGAGAIVTANLKDFPVERLPIGLQILPAHEFALNTVSLDPNRALRAITMIASRSGAKGPKRSVDELLGLLVDRYGLDEAVELLRTDANTGIDAVE